MPLKYFHCPDKPLMWKTIGDCLACDHQCVGGPEWLTVLWDENMNDHHEYHNDPKVISVTEALGCLRKAYFDKTKDYAEEPASLMARTLGTHGHRLVESHYPDGAEVGFTHPLSNGRLLRGTADVSRPGIVRDWKFVERPTKTMGGPVFEDEEGKRTHVQCWQVGVYDELAGGGNKKEICQVHRKGVKVHEAYDVPDAMERCVERAETLGMCLDSYGWQELPKDGERIRYFKWCVCDSCPHKSECKEG